MRPEPRGICGRIDMGRNDRAFSELHEVAAGIQERFSFPNLPCSRYIRKATEKNTAWPVPAVPECSHFRLPERTREPAPRCAGSAWDSADRRSRRRYF